MNETEQRYQNRTLNLFRNGISHKTGQGLHDGKVPTNEEQLWIHIFVKIPLNGQINPYTIPFSFAHSCSLG